MEENEIAKANYNIDHEEIEQEKADLLDNCGQNDDVNANLLENDEIVDESKV